ncbi:MAG: hypothetical protein Q9M28_10575 [Mariprofundaceae bacterium]|nr:hypothetical protein [Mariprofundaceae bacterium]
MNKEAVIQEINKRAEALNNAACGAKAIAEIHFNELDANGAQKEWMLGMVKASQILAEHAEYHSNKLWNFAELLDTPTT